MEPAITMTEAAQRLGVSRKTLYRLVRERSFPARRDLHDRRQRLIPVSALEALDVVTRQMRTRGATANPESEGDRLEEGMREHENTEVSNPSRRHRNAR